MIIPRRMGWVGNVACMGERSRAYRVFVGKPEGKRYLQYLVVDGRPMLTGILKK